MGARCINYTLFGNLLQRCSDRRLTRQAGQLHARLVLSSTIPDSFLGSKLIAFYSKAQNLKCARHVFDQIPQKNTFAYNALLIALTANKRHDEALELFQLGLYGDGLGLADVRPDSFTLSSVLKSMSEVAYGGGSCAAMVHCYTVKNGLDSNVFVGNGLVTCYSRCCDLASARELFDEMPERDLISWNSMISGYAQGGFHEECKELYSLMLDSKGVRPDSVTALSVLQACAQSSDLELGIEVHHDMVLNLDGGTELDLPVCNAILAVYAKCGSLDYARLIFEEMSEKDEITYSTIVSGYMIHGFVDEAMKLFEEIKSPGLSTWNAVISGRVQNNRYDKVFDLVRGMQARGLKPNCVTLSSVLPTVPYVSHLKAGKEIHAYAIKIHSDRNIYVTTSLIDTYAKRGYISGSQRVFDQTMDRSVIVWTAIISAHASHGDAYIALDLFDQMLRSRTKPDEVTFTAVLTACAHSGLVDKAWEVFHDLLPKHGINPLANHYACVVDCLCRAGKLREASEFVKKMPVEPSAQVWGALLGGAAEYGDVELAEYVCDRLFVLEPENPSNYIVMANLYSKAERWDEAEMVREKLRNIGFKKVAGSSRIEMYGVCMDNVPTTKRTSTIQ